MILDKSLGLTALLVMHSYAVGVIPVQHFPQLLLEADLIRISTIYLGGETSIWVSLTNLIAPIATEDT